MGNGVGLSQDEWMYVCYGIGGFHTKKSLDRKTDGKQRSYKGSFCSFEVQNP